MLFRTPVALDLLSYNVMDCAGKVPDSGLYEDASTRYLACYGRFNGDAQR